VVAGIQGRVGVSSKERALLHRLPFISAREQSARRDTFQQEGQEITAGDHIGVLVGLSLAVKVLDQEMINLGGWAHQLIRSSSAVMDLNTKCVLHDQHGVLEQLIKKKKIEGQEKVQGKLTKGT